MCRPYGTKRAFMEAIPLKIFPKEKFLKELPPKGTFSPVGTAHLKLALYIYLIYSILRHQCTNIFALRNFQQIIFTINVKNDDGNVIFLANRESRHIHH